MEIETYKISCAHCKTLFWITNDHDNRLRKSHETFYCPNGHPQSYSGKTCEKKLEEAKRDLNYIKMDLEHESLSNRALRGVITKMKNKGGK